MIVVCLCETGDCLYSRQDYRQGWLNLWTSLQPGTACILPQGGCSHECSEFYENHAKIVDGTLFQLVVLMPQMT